jgi:predicted O-methyltransferase YrrM
VDAELRTLLSDLFDRGVAHDAAEPDRLRRLRNLEPATAELLTFILRVAGAREIVEIGTSNGYSAIWLADAARDTGGWVTSVDVEQWPGVAENLERTGVSVRRELADGGTIWPAARTRASTCCSWTPNASSTPAGGHTRCGC